MTTGPDEQPAWSPNGKFIAFVRVLKEESADQKTEIGVVNIAAHTLRWVIKNGNDNETPSWSPDSKVLLYSSNATATGSLRLRLVTLADLKSRALQHLPPGDCEFPSWSPANHRILFVWVTAKDENTKPRLYEMRDLESPPIALPLTRIVSDRACWSPDGRHIAYLHWTANEACGLCIADVNGRHSVQIRPKSGLENTDSAPAW